MEIESPSLGENGCWQCVQKTSTTAVANTASSSQMNAAGDCSPKRPHLRRQANCLLVFTLHSKHTQFPGYWCISFKEYMVRPIPALTLLLLSVFLNPLMPPVKFTRPAARGHGKAYTKLAVLAVGENLSGSLATAHSKPPRSGVSELSVLEIFYLNFNALCRITSVKESNRDKMRKKSKRTLSLTNV